MHSAPSVHTRMSSMPCSVHATIAAYCYYALHSGGLNEGAGHGRRTCLEWSAPLRLPQVQFVVCLAGSWYVETTDGDRKDFSVGEVLYQVSAGRLLACRWQRMLAMRCCRLIMRRAWPPRGHCSSCKMCSCRAALAPPPACRWFHQVCCAAQADLACCSCSGRRRGQPGSKDAAARERRERRRPQPAAHSAGWEQGIPTCELTSLTIRAAAPPRQLQPFGSATLRTLVLWPMPSPVSDLFQVDKEPQVDKPGEF